jgi:hypothetical protein
MDRGWDRKITPSSSALNGIECQSKTIIMKVERKEKEATQSPLDGTIIHYIPKAQARGTHCMAYTLILHSTNKARDHCAFQETDDPLLECTQATGR